MRILSCFSRVQLFVTPWIVVRRAPLSLGSCGKNTGVGCHPPGDLPNRGMESKSPTLQVDSLPSEPPGKPSCVYMYTHTHIYSHTYILKPRLLYVRERHFCFIVPLTLGSLVQQLKLYLNNIVSFCFLQPPPPAKLFLLRLTEVYCHHGPPVKEVTWL